MGDEFFGLLDENTESEEYTLSEEYNALLKEELDIIETEKHEQEQKEKSWLHNILRSNFKTMVLVPRVIRAVIYNPLKSMRANRYSGLPFLLLTANI